MDELEKRTSKNSVKEFDLETNEDFSLNLGNNDEELESKPKVKEENESTVKNKSSRSKRYHHNPYEEKYADEIALKPEIIPFS